MPLARIRHLSLAALLLAWPMAPAFGYEINEQFSVDAELFAYWSQTETDQNGGFKTGRTHLGAEASQEAWRLRILLELDPNNNGGADDGKVRLREGYAQMTMAGNQALRFGVQPNAMVAVDEARLWGLRQVAPTFVEFWGLTPAADSGLSLLGANNAGEGGLLDYEFSISNGEGYDQPVNGEGNAFSARIGLHDGPWEIGGFVYTETDNQDPALAKDPERYLYYAAYDGPALRFSGQYLTGDDGDNGSTFNDVTGHNIQGTLKLESLTLFARQDRIRPIDGGTKQSLVIYGLAMDLSPNVRLTGHYQLRDFGPNDEASVAITTRVTL